MTHKPKCDNELTTIRTSSESHLHGKNHYLKNLLFFRIYADFQAYNEIDKSSIGNKTANSYKQIPVPNGYHIISGLDDILKNGYYESPLGHNNVDWFVHEVIEVENKMNFYFKITKKDIIMAEEDEEDYRSKTICHFCEKEIINKVRDQCHLTDNYRGPAHVIWTINVALKQSNFIPFIFHIFSNYDCHIFFKRQVGKKNDKVKFDFIPKTNEKYISVTYGFIRIIESYRFFSKNLDNLVETLVDNIHKTLNTLKEESVGHDNILNIVNEIEKMLGKEE